MATITRVYGPADYIELHHDQIEQWKIDLATMLMERNEARRSAAAWKQAAKMHREDALAFEQTIRGYEKDLAGIRRERDEARNILVNIAIHAGRSWTDSQMGPPTQFMVPERYILPAIEFVKETKMESDDRLAPGKPNSSVEMVMISAADMARLKKLEAERNALLKRVENLTEYTWWSEWQQARKERDEARAVARRLNKRLKAIEAAVPKMAIYDNFRDPIDAMEQMEHYIRTEIPKLHAGQINDKEGYDDWAKYCMECELWVEPYDDDRKWGHPCPRFGGAGRCESYLYSPAELEKEGYDIEAFEEAMELKNKLP